MPGATFEADTPRALFETTLPVNALRQEYSVSADGKRFLLNAPLETTASPMTVVLNWPALLFGRVLRAPRMVALVVFALLACLHTWPLATNPAHLSRTDNGDALLNMWAVAWVAHQLPRNPLHLFDANIFHPERLTLAYSEAMIVQGVLSLPIGAAGGSPVLAFNLVLLAGFALTGWAFCLLIHRWTGSWAAGYTTGSLAAFNSHVLA